MQKAKQVAVLVSQYRFEQRHRGSPFRRTVVSGIDPAKEPIRIEIGRKDPLTNVQQIRVALQGQGKHSVLAIEQESVAIDPSPFRVLDIVVHDENVDGADQLEIPAIGKEIGLHDSRSHGVIAAKYSLNKNLVTRALGIEAIVPADIVEYRVEANDIYLLNSDGLTDMRSRTKSRPACADTSSTGTRSRACPMMHSPRKSPPMGSTS